MSVSQTKSNSSDSTGSSKSNSKASKSESVIMRSNQALSIRPKVHATEISFAVLPTETETHEQLDKKIEMRKRRGTKKSLHTMFKASRTDTKYSNICGEYEGVDKVAKRFVRSILSRKSKHKSIHVLGSYVSSSTSSSSERLFGFLTVFSGWPTIAEFDEKLGRDKIYEFMSTWEYEENWLYEVTFITAKSGSADDFYLYEIVWSIPTKQYPIAQATASVFFTFEVSRIKPPSCLVEAYYNFEGQSHKFRPFKHANPETLLFNIVDAKLKFYQTLRF